MQFLSLISSNKDILIPLSQNNSIKQPIIKNNNNINLAQLNQSQEQTQKQYPTIENQQNDEYIIYVLLIQKNIICTVSTQSINFHHLLLKTNEEQSTINKQEQQKIEQHHKQTDKQKFETNDHNFKQHNHNFKSKSDKQTYIGSINLNQHIKQQMVSYFDQIKQNQQQNQKLQQQKAQNLKYQQNQQYQPIKQVQIYNKYQFSNLSIIQQKGIIYDMKLKRFFVIVKSQKNIYLITFNLQISSHINDNVNNNCDNDNNYEYNMLENTNIKITNFDILYDFKAFPQHVKYNLQLNPQIMYLQASAVLILVRKFYNDSFVIVFRNCYKQIYTSDQVINQDKISQLKNRNKQQKSDEISPTVFSQKARPIIPSQEARLKYLKSLIYWKFYINQQCLSPLDNYNFLINYRQIIIKPYFDIEVIDIRRRQKRISRIGHQPYPLTIKRIISLMNPPQSIRILQAEQQYEKIFYNLIKKQKNKIENFEQQHQPQQVIRIFTALNIRTQSYILDYDIAHQIPISATFIDKILIQNVSLISNNQNNLTQQIKSPYFFINFINRYQNKMAVVGKDLSKFRQNFQQSSILFDDSDDYLWQVNLGILIGYRILLKQQILKVKMMKIADKLSYYVHILGQLNKKSIINRKNENSRPQDQIIDSDIFDNAQFVRQICSLLYKEDKMILKQKSSEYDTQYD